MCERDEPAATRLADARFDQFWPRGQAFPPSAPWLGSLPRDTWRDAYRTARGAGPAGPAGPAMAGATGGPKNTPVKPPGGWTSFVVDISPDALADVVEGLRGVGVEVDTDLVRDLLVGLANVVGDDTATAIEVYVNFGANGSISINLHKFGMETVIVRDVPTTEPRTDPNPGGQTGQPPTGGGETGGTGGTGGGGGGEPGDDLSDDGNDSSGKGLRWCDAFPDHALCDYDDSDDDDESETPDADMSVGDACGFLPRYCESTILLLVDAYLEGSMATLDTRTDTATDELLFRQQWRLWYAV